MKRSALLIIRIGGLPCDVMEAFASSCGKSADRVSALQKDLRHLRLELVDRLHTAIHGASQERRNALLPVKRDCYNGRTLATYRQTPSWQFIEEAGSEIASRVLDLEEALHSASEDFVAVYEREINRQQERVAALAQDPVLRCGLAIANPQVARESARLIQKAGVLYGRREKRLVTTLLRYVSRAALKLSPFSTLTPTGLLTTAQGDDPLTLLKGAWQRRSLVRVRRHILDRCSDLLLRYDPWRRSLVVSLNDSAEQLEDGRTLFLRPSHYRLNEEKMKLEFQDESLVRVRIPWPLLERLRSLCQPAGRCCSELTSVLAAELGMPEAAAKGQIDRLLDIGFLHLLTPWSSDEGHLERVMIREYGRICGDGALTTFVAEMNRLVNLEEGLLDSEDPVATFLEMDRSIHELLDNAASSSGSQRVDVQPRDSGHNIYHDVWSAPEAGGVQAVAHIGRTHLEKALCSVEPLLLWSRLFDHRIDFLYSLGALLSERSGTRRELSLLTAFDAAQPLWQDFIKFQVQSRDTADQWRATWNPGGLTILHELAFWREVAHHGIGACLIDGPDGRHVLIDALHALLRPIPETFTHGYGGACLFLQPASPDGSLWMANRLKEGIGRFASRYTPLMPPSLQREYGDALTGRGTLEIDGEPVQLIDIHCVRGDTLNLHTPQTPSVITFPGTRLDITPERRRTLRELVITIAADELPHVRDRSGLRYLPVHLGLCYHDYLPTLVKFLCAFGPGEMGSIFPPPLQRQVEGVVIQERSAIGNVLLHRKSWRVPTELLRKKLEAPCEAEAFATFRRWHEAHGIPERVFAVEKVPHPLLGSRHQPQYLDLGSPLFIRMLRSMLLSQDESFEFVEMLPSPDMFPRDADGRAWAVELLVDSLAVSEDTRITPLPVPIRQMKNNQPQR